MKVKLTYILLFFTVFAFSQEKEKSKDKYLPKGNDAFAEKDYTSAEADYRISQSKTPANADAAYNLGNAIYRQGQSGESMYAYLKAIENAQDKTQKHKAFHNLGNALMKEKDYQNAVEAYKNALRNNPYDEETRYNFALAKEMLKNNPPPPQPPKDDKKDDKSKDKNKDDKSQQPKDDNKDKGDQGDQKDKGDKGDEKDKGGKDKGDRKDKGEGKDKEEKGGEGNEQEQDAPNPDKQRMKNLLDAMNNEEKKIQDKINAKKVKVQPKQQEKDW
ncbi:tetratricopeptide repeat protein [Flavobacterium salilacus subsp. salilacus]|uniref:tetratricopeptide repeat protein n=1 Tax=Flavobacterium TaxID=237 RepID=UPI0010756285|nr:MULTISPECIES: tetratricopeptide repeat protein [Flavobacterium]KAF2515092.1 tetratricopeptide repeat protein [Flavobacterium salilacus subsp. salilacus]MBE1615885.1 tetratricopeptide repeat protein [Flavobacterium sp. SaA2.13]